MNIEYERMRYNKRFFWILQIVENFHVHLGRLQTE